MILYPSYMPCSAAARCARAKLRRSGAPVLLLLLSFLFIASAHAQRFAIEQGLAELPEAPQAAAPQPAAPVSSSQQLPAAPAQAAPAEAPKIKKQPTSAEILEREEKQRILGVMPMFQAVDTADDVPPMTPRQKFHLMYKSSTDPFIFGLDAFVAGIGQAKDSNPGFGQGAQGYFKRFGSSYLDTLDGNFWGNAVLPVLLKEDPRYFRMGTGTFKRRFFYSALTTVWCRRDNGKSGPNYANVLGNFISGGISNAYYPAEDRGVEKTLSGAVTVTLEGTFGAELIEFWPDIARRIVKKHTPKT